jgi:hypothetical protein
MYGFRSGQYADVFAPSLADDLLGFGPNTGPFSNPYDPSPPLHRFNSGPMSPFARSHSQPSFDSFALPDPLSNPYYQSTMPIRSQKQMMLDDQLMDPPYPPPMRRDLMEQLPPVSRTGRSALKSSGGPFMPQPNPPMRFPPVSPQPEPTFLQPGFEQPVRDPLFNHDMPKRERGRDEKENNKKTLLFDHQLLGPVPDGVLAARRPATNAGDGRAGLRSGPRRSFHVRGHSGRSASVLRCLPAAPLVSSHRAPCGNQRCEHCSMQTTAITHYICVCGGGGVYVCVCVCV